MPAIQVSDSRVITVYRELGTVTAVAAALHMTRAKVRGILQANNIATEHTGRPSTLPEAERKIRTFLLEDERYEVLKEVGGADGATVGLRRVIDAYLAAQAVEPEEVTASRAGGGDGPRRTISDEYEETDGTLVVRLAPCLHTQSYPAGQWPKGRRVRCRKCRATQAA